MVDGLFRHCRNLEVLLLDDLQNLRRKNFLFLVLVTRQWEGFENGCMSCRRFRRVIRWVYGKI